MNILYTVGLVVMQNNRLLLVRKRKTFNFMLPGGKIDVGEEVIDCLEREVQEELQCQVNRATLRSLGEFTDVAANEPDTLVSMRLYEGQLTGTVRPSREIEELHWFDFQESEGILIAPLVYNQIIPLVTHILSSSNSPLN